MKRILAACFFSLIAGVALAQDAPLADPAAEARAQTLMREIRCVACENEPVSQSAAPIAEDMRRKVRELVADGASDAQVRDWFRARYGDFVLFRPSQAGWTGGLLWGAPFMILLAGGWIVWRVRRPRSEAQPVAPEDL